MGDQMFSSNSFIPEVSTTATFVDGDVVIKDSNGNVSDLLRINSSLFGVFVYSSDTGAPADQAIPSQRLPNVIELTEDSSGFISYTPSPGQPGFLSGGLEPVPYVFRSDENLLYYYLLYFG